jgi:hypothetical protein
MSPTAVFDRLGSWTEVASNNFTIALADPTGHVPAGFCVTVCADCAGESMAAQAPGLCVYVACYRKLRLFRGLDRVHGVVRDRIELNSQ